VHLTLGILRHPKHFHRCGVFSTPQQDTANAPAQVTQTVGRLLRNNHKGFKMEPEIVNAIITAIATILAAIIGGWISLRISLLPKDEIARNLSALSKFTWFMVGALIGGGLLYFLLYFFLLKNLPSEREISLTLFVPKSTHVGNERFHIGEFVDYRGNTYNSCFWAHAPSELTFDLNGKFSKFSATALFHDYGDCEAGCSDGAQFVIILDNREIFRSETMFVDSNPVNIEVDVSYGHELVLITDDGAMDDKSADWTIWCKPSLK
jgi:hypothetical protein